jgi:hypothetical protein
MRPIVIAVLLALILMAEQQARAAEPKLVALSCDGSITGTVFSKPKPTEKMGVVVNLEEQTVSFEGWVARIEYADATLIRFGGKQLGQQIKGMDITILGQIDRVTGHMAASTSMSDPNSKTSDIDSTFDMYCKATNRVF